MASTKAKSIERFIDFIYRWGISVDSMYNDASIADRGKEWHQIKGFAWLNRRMLRKIIPAKNLTLRGMAFFLTWMA